MTQYAFIWDVDGTLVDSYSCIVPAVKKYCEDNGVYFNEDYIRDYAIRFSVGKLLDQIGPMIGRDPEEMKQEYETYNDKAIQGIQAIAGAKDILEKLTREGHLCFIFTHRGASCHTILEDTGLAPYFTEVVTTRNGFPRKPEPDGILYLLEKYKLNPERSYYVGDRTIDIQAGNNAGTGSILFLREGSPVEADGTESLVVHDLMDIYQVVSIRGRFSD